MNVEEPQSYTSQERNKNIKSYGTLLNNHTWNLIKLLENNKQSYTNQERNKNNKSYGTLLNNRTWNLIKLLV